MYFLISLLSEPKIEAISELEQFNKDWIPVLGLVAQILIPIVAIVATWVIYKYQTNSGKRQKTLDLYKQFQDLDFYMQVIAPVWKIYLKWENLPDPKRDQYRRAVALAWIQPSPPRNMQVLKDWIPDFKLSKNYKAVHYLDKIKVSSLTEYETLTIFLEFWSQLWFYKQKGLIEADLLIIFSKWYNYYRPLIELLRDYILALKQTKFQDSTLPQWIENTNRLSEFMDHKKMAG